MGVGEEPIWAERRCWRGLRKQVKKVRSLELEFSAQLCLCLYCIFLSSPSVYVSANESPFSPHKSHLNARSLHTHKRGFPWLGVSGESCSFRLLGLWQGVIFYRLVTRYSLSLLHD